MKKVLLASAVAIAAAAGIGSTAARADDPVKLTLGGNIVEWVGYIGSDTSLFKDAGITSVNTFTQYQDSDIVFSGSSKLDNGLTVGATIDLKAGPSLQETGENSKAAQYNPVNALSYITVSGAFGSVNAGRMYDVIHDNAIDAPEEGYLFVQDGYWGDPFANGGFLGYTFANTTGRTVMFDQNSSTNIRYTTPAFSGFQLGVDYAEANDQAAGGLVNLQSSTALSTTLANAQTYKDAYHIVGTYGGDFGDAKVKAFIGYGALEGRTTAGTVGPFYNTTAVNGGLSVTIKGFTVAGSVIDRMNPSGGATTNLYKIDGQSGTSWDIGAAYESGPWGVSIAYLYSASPDAGTNANDPNLTDTLQFYEIGAHYTLGPGVTLNGNIYGTTTKADFASLASNAAAGFNTAGTLGTATGVGALLSTNVAF